MLADLMTKAGEELRGTPWTVHPRPQMKRDSWLNLNGEWEFSTNGHAKFDRILVPFCPESRLSGIGTHFQEREALCYRRSFTLPEGFNRGRSCRPGGGGLCQQETGCPS